MDDRIVEEAAVEDHTAERLELLRLARQTIAAYVTTGDTTPYETDDPWLQRLAAVFVTLRVRPAPGQVALPGEEQGELRGCIGQVEAELPLYLAVQSAAVKAATVDPRFYPVQPEELDTLLIEISILSAMRPVRDLDDIAIGRDGLLISGSGRRGLLLPEVPVHFDWDQAEFVRNLCHKAGLPTDAWPARARLYAFTTDSFEES